MRQILVSSCLATALALVPDSSVSAQWTLQPLTPPSALVEDVSASFGGALATCTIDDVAWLFVGEPDALQSGGGVVHVYRQAHNTWLYTGAISPASAVAGDRVGMQLAASGGTLVVGTEPSGARGVFVFEFDGTNWNEAANLTPGTFSSGLYGHLIAVHGDVVLIADSVPPGTENPDTATHVEIYRRDETLDAWSLEVNLAPPPLFDPDLATISAIDVRTNGIVAEVLIACPQSSASDGSVQLYHRDPVGLWTSTESFPGDGSDGYANNAAFTAQGKLIVGAPGATVGEVESAGEARVYEPQIVSPQLADWTLVQTISQGPLPVSNARFAERLVLASDRLVLTAPGDPALGPHVFEHLGGLGGFWIEYEPLPATFDGADRLALLSTELLATKLSSTGTTSGVVRRVGYPNFLAPPLGDVLQVSPATLALDVGGTQCMQLTLGAEHAGEAYLIVGSASGTASPIVFQGFEIPLTLPDNVAIADYFAYTIGAAPIGTPPLRNSFGVLNANGEARPSFEIPPFSDPLFAGVELHHAAVVFAAFPPMPVVSVSNATSLQLEGSLPPVLRLMQIVPPNAVTQSGTDPVSFQVQVSALAGAAAIASYTWDFGDGSAVETSRVPVASHEYAVGVFTGWVTVNDTLGGTDSLSFDVANLTYPVAVASTETLLALPGETVTISGAQSSDADGGQIMGYCWSPILPTCTPEADVEFTLPLDAQHGETFTFSLVVIDDENTASPFPSSVTIETL